MIHPGCPRHCPGRPHWSVWIARAVVVLVTGAWAVATVLLWRVLQ